MEDLKDEPQPGGSKSEYGITTDDRANPDCQEPPDYGGHSSQDKLDLPTLTTGEIVEGFCYEGCKVLTIQSADQNNVETQQQPDVE